MAYQCPVAGCPKRASISALMAHRAAKHPSISPSTYRANIGRSLPLPMLARPVRRRVLRALLIGGGVLLLFLLSAYLLADKT